MANKRERIIKKYSGKCQICGKQTNMNNWRDMPELDHIIPRKHGGSNKEENLSLLCSTCNNKKGDRYGFALLQKILEDAVSVLGEFDEKHLAYEFKNRTITRANLMLLKNEIEKEFDRVISIINRTVLDGE